jgi:hypothetical protein
MLLPENLSPIFSNKPKSTSNSGDIGAGTINNSHDIIEHDVTGLTNMSNLPKP